MVKLSFKTEIIISFLTECGNVGIFDMEKNLEMSEMKPNVETSRVNRFMIWFRNLGRRNIFKFLYLFCLFNFDLLSLLFYYYYFSSLLLCNIMFFSIYFICCYQIHHSIKYFELNWTALDILFHETNQIWLLIKIFQRLRSTMNGRYIRTRNTIDWSARRREGSSRLMLNCDKFILECDLWVATSYFGLVGALKLHFAIHLWDWLFSVLDLWENQRGSAMYFFDLFRLFFWGSIQTWGLRGTRGG